jgi:hypothetical protein
VPGLSRDLSLKGADRAVEDPLHQAGSGPHGGRLAGGEGEEKRDAAARCCGRRLAYALEVNGRVSVKWQMSKMRWTARGPGTIARMKFSARERCEGSMVV